MRREIIGGWMEAAPSLYHPYYRLGDVPLSININESVLGTNETSSKANLLWNCNGGLWCWRCRCCYCCGLLVTGSRTWLFASCLCAARSFLGGSLVSTLAGFDYQYAFRQGWGKERISRPSVIVMSQSSPLLVETDFASSLYILTKQRFCCHSWVSVDLVQNKQTEWNRQNQQPVHKTIWFFCRAKCQTYSSMEALSYINTQPWQKNCQSLMQLMY